PGDDGQKEHRAGEYGRAQEPDPPQGAQGIADGMRGGIEMLKGAARPRPAIAPGSGGVRAHEPWIRASISASSSRRGELFAALKIASTRESVASIPRFSSQKTTFERPLMGPTRIFCSSPSSP